VLCLSIRATGAPVAEEMLDAWFGASPTQDPVYRAMIAALERAEGPRTRAAPDQSAVHRTVD
jgi:ribose 5-phosphate isomerase B